MNYFRRSANVSPYHAGLKSEAEPIPEHNILSHCRLHVLDTLRLSTLDFALFFSLGREHFIAKNFPYVLWQGRFV